jgi:hypothetical protein
MGRYVVNRFLAGFSFPMIDRPVPRLFAMPGNVQVRCAGISGSGSMGKRGKSGPIGIQGFLNNARLPATDMDKLGDPYILLDRISKHDIMIGS